MSNRRFIHLAQHRPSLQPTRLHSGQHSLDETAPRRTGTAEGVLPPQHATPQQTLRVMVRGLYPLGHHETPHGREQLQQVRTERRRLPIRAAATGPKQPLPFLPRAIQPLRQLLVVHTPAAEQVPFLEPPLRDGLQFPAPPPRRAAAVYQLLEVPLQRRPTDLAAERRPPAGGTPAVAAHESL